MLSKYVEILTSYSYITGRLFIINHKDEYADMKNIRDRDRECPKLAYILYTSNITKLEETEVAIYTYDTVLLATDKDQNLTSRRLDAAICKSTIEIPTSLDINETTMPYENHNKYIGMTKGNKCRWEENVNKNIMELSIKYGHYCWLLLF